MYNQDYDYDEYDEYDDGGAYGYDDAAVDATAMSSANAAGGGIGGDIRSEARTMAMKEVLDMQASVVDEVARLTCLSSNAATLLLGNFFWSKDVAVERYFEDPEGVLQKLSLTPEIASHANTLCSGHGGTNMMCGICCLDYEPEEMFSLSACKHSFCKECWQDHIKAHVHSNLLSTRCPSQQCKEVLGIRNMTQLFDGSSVTTASAVLKDIYREYLSSFVQSCPSLYWCPNPVGCSGIIHVEVPPLQGQGVTCDVCHQAFCLRCASEPHRPATCDNMRNWLRYCSAEGANVAFILVKTKRCPKCHKDIEKNGGCNHMTCKCGYQFCWVCGMDWSSHSGDYYSCKNAGIQPASSETDGIKQSQRFMYHYERYTLHLDSAKRDAAFISNYLGNGLAVNDTEKALRKEMQRGGGAAPCPVESAISAVDVISLIKNALVSARPVIAHAYAQMYYLDDKSTESMMMAHRVGKLEEATEQLSGKVVEYLRLAKSQPGPLLDLVNYVSNWQKILCEA
jgi:ariadne-1